MSHLINICEVFHGSLACRMAYETFVEIRLLLERQIGKHIFTVGSCLCEAAVGVSWSAHGLFIRGRVCMKERLAKGVRVQDTG